MATTRCPSCGDLFLDGTATCPSCGVAVEGVDAGRPAEARPARAGSDAQESRELHEWTMEGRRLLDGMLHRAGIPRSWQGSTLSTPAVEHDRVEEMVDLVGHGDAQVGLEEPDDEPDDERADEPEVPAATLAADDEDAEPAEDVGYDLSGWTDLARGDLIAALAEAGIEHGWDDDGDLVVGGADEARVDALFDQLTGSGGGPAATDTLPTDNFYDAIDDDGLLVQETLSDLFVGADRLRHNPLDGSAARLLLDGRDRARALRLPFGFERSQWQAILGAVEALAGRFEPATLDDDAIRDDAMRLRTLLRDVV